MKHSDVEELLGVYALDALDADEAHEVEAHLEACGRCRAEVAQHRQTAAAMAGLLATPSGHGGGPAPEGVWERIAGELGDHPDVGRDARAMVVPFARPEVARNAQTRWLAAAAVVAFVLAAGLGAMLVRQDRRIDSLNARDEAQAELAAALVDPKSRRVQLASGDGTKTMGAIVTADGPSFLVAGSLPSLDDARTYQLWAIRAGVPRSLAVLGRQMNGVTRFEFDGNAEALAITVERAGGAVAPSGDPIVQGFLTAAPI